MAVQSTWHIQKEGITPLVGDKVKMEVLPDGDGVINEIEDRKNVFIRPPAANVDQFVIVTAAARPDPIPDIIDKFLVMAENNETKIVLCINKMDIAKPENISGLKEIYEKMYPVYCVSGKTGEGTEELKKILPGKRTAFAGPSGVGKSTLLNCIEPKLDVETGNISEKTKRGKHTTRHVELFSLEDGSMLYDTPGFTSMDVSDVDEEELHHLYPEMAPYIGQCRYDNCRHIKEPGCAVREAVDKGNISQSRYGSYISQIEEIRKEKKY